MGKGSSSPAPAPSSQTVTNTSIPEYARPYVETMLGKSEALTATPYQTYGGQRIAEFSPLQQQAFQNVAGMQVAPEVGQASRLAGVSGLGALGTAGQMANVGQQYASQFTNPYATQAYMSPYLQSALAPQLSEIQRQSDITQQALKGQAVQAGAFGGTRQALQASEAERNKQALMNQTVGQGYQKAFEAAQQAQQFGANLGLQGLQGALSGLSTAGQMAGTLGQLGQTGFGQQQAINAAQQQVGATQQAQAQQQLDLAYQDFLKQKNYPYQQLGFMSDMLRGLPLSQTAQQMYTAPPSMVQQLGGLGMAGLGAYGAMGGFKAKGGVIKAKEGGLMDVKKYAVGGNIDSLTEEQLTKLLESPNLTPMEQMQIEQRLMLLRRMEMNPESSSIMSGGLGAAPTGSMIPQNYGMAGGGIVAFAGGKLVDENDDTEDDTDLDLEDEYILELMAPTSDATTVPTKGLPTPTNDVDIMRQAIAEATARRNIPLTPGEIAEKKLYESAPERAKHAEMRALSGLLMQTGFGAAGSKSRYPLQAFGQAGTAATPTFLKSMGEARSIEESGAKGLGALGRAQRAEQLAGITAGERLGLGAMGASSRERIAEKGLASRVEIAKLQRASMERIAQARRTDFQRKWELYTADAKKRNVEPNINEFRKLFPETKSVGYLRDIIKSDPTGNPVDWYRKADQMSRLENLSDEDKAALQWASDPKNAKDPRSAAIKSRLGL